MTKVDLVNVVVAESGLKKKTLRRESQGFFIGVVRLALNER